MNISQEEGLKHQFTLVITSKQFKNNKKMTEKKQ